MDVVLALHGEYVKLQGATVRRSSGMPVRGVVRGLSEKSRRRMLDFFAQLDRRAAPPGLFLTLTYSDASIETSWSDWKAHLQAVIRRLKRRYPGIGLVWRLQLEDRKSGDYVGVAMPHFHLLLWNVQAVDIDWLRSAWAEIVGTGDVCRVHIRRVNGWRQACSYLAKYVAKVQLESVATGRVWGVSGRACLCVTVVVISVDPAAWYRLRRVLRSWLCRRMGQGRLGWGRARGVGLTCYMPYHHVGRLLAWSAS